MLGSDDNLHFPIWDMTRQCVVELLEGGDADSATTLLDAQIAKWIHTEGDGAE